MDVANIRREHIEAFIATLLERWKPATANNRLIAVSSADTRAIALEKLGFLNAIGSAIKPSRESRQPGLGW